jgi:uncharacterized protein (DUF952 family)
MLIYKVLRAAEWAEFDRMGRTPGSAVDRADGYVHFSSVGQLTVTLARHFAGETGLILVAVDADLAGDALRWEPSRGGALFAAAVAGTTPRNEIRTALDDMGWRELQDFVAVA